jgi:hypothetical protein
VAEGAEEETLVAVLEYDKTRQKNIFKKVLNNKKNGN